MKRILILGFLLALTLLCTLLPAEVTASKYTIEEVTITGFLPPYPGVSMSDHLGRLGTPEDADYKITSAFWTYGKDSAGRYVHLNKSFVLDDNYYMVIHLEPTGTRRFNERNVDVAIGGQDAEGTYNGFIQEKPTVTASGGLTVVTKRFKTVKPTAVSHVDFTGYTTPVAGDIPYGKEQLSIADGCPVTITKVSFMDTTTNKETKDAFVSGRKYNVVIQLKPIAPALFANTATSTCNNGFFNPVVYVAETRDSAYITFLCTALDPINIDAATFPDATFRSFVKTNYDKNNNNRLDYNERMYVKEMDVSKNGNTLTSLEGLRHFPKLERLDCSDNYITEIVIYSRNLKYLNCARCKLTTFSLYTDSLEICDVRNNNFAQLNLGSWPVLRELYAQNNPNMTSMKLGGCPALEKLYASDCALTTLNIQGLEKLSNISIHGNSGLTSLNLNTNPILRNTVMYGEADMGSYQRYYTTEGTRSELVADKTLNLITGDGIAINEGNFPDMEMRACMEVWYDKNHDDHLSAEEIEAATEFKDLRSNIENTKGLEYLTALKKLYITESIVSEIDVSSLRNLEVLVLDDSRVKELDVSGMENLKTLSVKNNELEHVYFSNCPALEFLYLDGNPDLYEVDLKNLPLLGEADFSGTDITFLDLTEAPLLRSLVEDGYMDDMPTYYEYNGPEGVLYVNKDVWYMGITEVPIDDSTFPDDNFRAILSQEWYDLNQNGYFSQKELEAVEELEIAGENIASVEGLGYFTNLEHLVLDLNPLTELDVRPLLKLRDLSIDATELEGFEFDSMDNRIEYLCCSQTKIEDWAFLEDLMCLDELAIVNSGLTDEKLDTILKYVSSSLSTLNVRNNNSLTHLDAQSYWCTNYLEVLDASNCGMEYVTFNADHMRYLDVRGNQIKQVYIGGSGSPLVDVYLNGTHNSSSAGESYFNHSLKEYLYTDKDVLLVTYPMKPYLSNSTTLWMPTFLDTVEEGAFEGNPAISVYLDGVTDIGSRAFAGCPNLTFVLITLNSVSIADDAFEGSSNAHIIAYPGSTAQKYAYDHNIPYLIYDGGL